MLISVCFFDFALLISSLRITCADFMTWTQTARAISWRCWLNACLLLKNEDYCTPCIPYSFSVLTLSFCPMERTLFQRGLTAGDLSSCGQASLSSGSGYLLMDVILYTVGTGHGDLLCMVYFPSVIYRILLNGVRCTVWY